MGLELAAGAGPRTALFVAAFDSQLKWCAQLRDELSARGYRWRVVAPDTRTALSLDQIAAAGFVDVPVLPWDELVRLAAVSDVVVSALSGPSTQALILDLELRRRGQANHPAELDRPSPIVVCGWVGVIIEKITAGYLDRCGADVVAVNSVQDLDHFRTVADRLGLDAGNLLLSGLPLLGSEPAPPRTGPIRRVLFADQPTVPGPADERSYLYQRLIDYARTHPDREVILKPRHRPGEDTFHRMRHHPEDLLAGIAHPPNFRIGYESITDLLPETDLLLTVSSTACLEAIDHGCRVGLVLDLGVHERLGNHVFLDSGLLRTFDQLVVDDLGRPTPAWADGYFFPRTGTAAALIADRVLGLQESGSRPGAVVRSSDYLRGALDVHQRVIIPRRARAARSRWWRRGARVGRALPTPLTRPLRRAAVRLTTIGRTA